MAPAEANGHAHAALESAQDVEHSTDVFKKAWAVYQAAVEKDVLYHSSMFTAFRRHLEQRWLGRPVDLLDLGCGDGTKPAEVFRQLGGSLALRSYTGVDVSPAALALAQPELSFLQAGGTDVSLLPRDMKEYMESEAAPGSFDVVLQSFSLHHLTAEGKQEFLRLVHRALRPGGAMVWIDVYSLEEDGTDIEPFRRRLRARTGAMLSTEHARTVTDHACTYDLPERISAMRAMAQAAGFAELNVLATEGELCAALEIVRAAD